MGPLRCWTLYPKGLTCTLVAEHSLDFCRWISVTIRKLSFEPKEHNDVADLDMGSGQNRPSLRTFCVLLLFGTLFEKVLWGISIKGKTSFREFLI